MSRNLSPASKERYRGQMWLDILHRQTDGVDLVALVLENPSKVLHNGAMRAALLGRSYYPRDQEHIVQRPGITGTPPTADCWKLIICDGRHVEDSADLDRQYRAQLKAEELQTPEERAREAVRTSSERLARRNAKLMIPTLEKLSPEKYAMMLERGTLYTVWHKVMPKPLAWITDITEDGSDWGFVFYRSAQVMQRVGGRWDDALNVSRASTKSSIRRTWPTSPSLLRPVLVPSIVRVRTSCDTGPQSGLRTPFFVDGDLCSTREHFKEYRKTLDETDGILDNTLIIIDSDCVHPDLLTVDELNELPQLVFWVWACDADWEPPAGCEADEDGYQGRLKVPFVCLQAWFYVARLKDVDMKAMWKKAQGHPQQLWVCNSLPQREWKHEPYI
nr:uncharacterized protein CTRU02_10741 [Colletotrichum truncatum]KAF6786617.1 hypothetical protein CTRU02_10741 [Colletotrichum truncatum]